MTIGAKNNGTIRRGAVVITGASSGIGKASALRLDKEGFRVFAGVRKPEDGDALGGAASGGLVPVLIDVTDPRSIQDAVRTVEADLANAGLAGLVNNAGVGFAGPIEYFPLDEIERQFEVNVFGQVAVIQAFLPLLRQGRGRIVNVGSVGDRITLPFGGPLSACKSAFASLTEAMRLELHPWGVHVSLIEPASISTPAVDKVAAQGQRLIVALPPEGSRRYAEIFRGFLDRAVRREKNGSTPDVVANVIFKALTDGRPKTRYPVGKDARLLIVLSLFLPDVLLDPLRMRLFRIPSS